MYILTYLIFIFMYLISILLDLLECRNAKVLSIAKEHMAPSCL